MPQTDISNVKPDTWNLTSLVIHFKALITALINAGKSSGIMHVSKYVDRLHRWRLPEGQYPIYCANIT